MVGERAVDVAIQCLTVSRAAEELGAVRRHAVAAVDDDVEWPRELHVRNDAFEILLADILRAVPPLPS